MSICVPWPCSGSLGPEPTLPALRQRCSFPWALVLAIASLSGTPSCQPPSTDGASSLSLWECLANRGWPSSSTQPILQATGQATGAPHPPEGARGSAAPSLGGSLQRQAQEWQPGAARGESGSTAPKGTHRPLQRPQVSSPGCCGATSPLSVPQSWVLGHPKGRVGGSLSLDWRACPGPPNSMAQGCRQDTCSCQGPQANPRSRTPQFSHLQPHWARGLSRDSGRALGRPLAGTLCWLPRLPCTHCFGTQAHNYKAAA